MHNSISQGDVYSLKHQAVRDLAWSLWGKSFFTQPPPLDQEPDSFPLDWDWIKALDQQPEKLINYLEKQNTRLLGTYFEALWTFYFSHHPSFEQGYFNLQVSDNKRTLGEFDILLKDKQGRYFHIELTCKFYLQWLDKQREILWIGPNCGDRLDIKFHRTYNHQLPLLHTPLGQKVFQAKFIGTDTQDVQQIAIWRGVRFHNTQWFHVNQLAQVPAQDDEQIRWIIADKHLWLSPLLINDASKLMSFEQIKQQVENHFQQQAPYTLMLVGLSLQPKNNLWQQDRQYFITPNHWPQGKLSDSALTPLRPCRPPL